jgi:hypothetical protein
LELNQLAHAARGEFQQLIEFGPGKRLMFRCALNLDQALLASHDHVHIDFAARIFDVR